MIQRIAPSQIETDLPLRNAMEACWRAFEKNGSQSNVIDMDRGRVQGSKGASFSSYGKNYTAQFEASPNGHIITVRTEEAMQGSIDFGKNKRETAKLADKIIQELESAPTSTIEAPMAVEPSIPISPIASPTGAPAMLGTGSPVYGRSLPSKRGTGVLIYGLLGVSCCQIAAPFALVYGLKALKAYKIEDPGDRGMVLTGTILGAVGLLILVGRIVVILTNFSSF